MTTRLFDGVSDETLVEEARAFYAEADKIEKEADSLKERASNEKWGAADRCYALSNRGWSQAKIAQAVGVHRNTISFWVRMVDPVAQVPVQKRVPFGEAYVGVNASAGTDPTYERHAAAFVKTATPEKVAAVMAQAPTQTRASVLVEASKSEDVQEVIGMSDDKTLDIINAAHAASRVNTTSKGIKPKRKKKEAVEDANGDATIAAQLAEASLSLEMIGAAGTLVNWAKQNPTSEALAGAIEVLEEGIEIAKAIISGGTVTDDEWEQFSASLAAGSEE